jgi:hypothetical protein
VIDGGRQKTRRKFHFATENRGLDTFLQAVGAFEAFALKERRRSFPPRDVSSRPRLR